jgi:site-specific DNA-methyltransferase (adenine-specific)
MLSRIKFEIDPLVEEILDQLPNLVWHSKTSTFFDPAIGGGQFVRTIEQRLRSCGHSDANIRNRVFGFENSELHIRYAVNKHNLVGQYVRKPYVKFFELDNTMKFDVVVGNPPYQDPDNDKRMLWNQILDKMAEITEDNGYIAVVTPSTWLTSSTNIHNSYRVFEEKQVEEAVIFDKSDSPFEEGTTVSYCVIKNTPRKSDTNLYFAKHSKKTKDLVGTINIAKEKFWPGQLEPINLAIHNKLKSFAKIEFVKSCEFHNQGLKKKQRVSDTKSKDFPYTHYVSAAITRYTSVKFSKHDTWKVMVPLTSTIDKAVIDNNCGHGEDMLSLYVANEETAKNIRAIFKTRFYKFIGKLYKNGRNQPLQNLFPIVDFTRTWTDAELYQLVGLTQEEIDYVEASIK